MKRDAVRGGGHFSHALEALEFHAVLGAVGRYCRTPGGRARVEALRPGIDAAAIDARLAAVVEAQEYQAVHGNLPIADTAVRDWVERAVRERDIIPPEALLRLAATEREVLEIRRRVAAHAEDYPRTASVIAAFVPHAALVTRIDATIDRDGAIRDNASTLLGDIRRQMQKAREDIRTFSERLAREAGGPEMATFTGSRYLLLVPREKCRRKEGIVHAMSHSGGSLYFEPFALVEKNNRLETLVQDEQAEQARILAELTDQVVAVEATIVANIDRWEELDALSAQARFASEFGCVSPQRSDEPRLRLVRARHPLLQMSLRERDPSAAVVPLDLELRPDERVVVVTGPNAGGKTVALKTVGLLVLMYQSGLPVPCDEGSYFCLFERVYADIGDEQSITSSLSTFTSHLRHLDAMCRGADERVLCLVDEIGVGTAPDEGASLAIAALEHLIAHRAAVVATTHLGKVKAFALATEGVGNASVLFDDAEGQPLYRLVQGSAGRSRGIDTARRVDFHPAVVNRARELLGADAYRLEELLSGLEAEKLALEADRKTLEQQSARLSDLVNAYETRESHLREYESERREKARQEAESLLLKARREIEGLVKEIRETQARREAVRSSHRRLENLLEETKAPETPVANPARDVHMGDRVALSAAGEPSGVVQEVDRGYAVVDMHGKRIRVRVDRLFEARTAPPPTERRTYDVDVEPLESPSLDVRGCDRAEALERVDRFLDRAVLNSTREVTIIHGVGEGVLAPAIRNYLINDGRVTDVRAGRHGEGGPGVSVVQLK